jgi:uncharacterized protein
MQYIWIAFIGGALAFAHCLGMCGGFVLHLAGAPTRQAMLVRQLLWHIGKITTYVFLGALAGFLGAWFIASDKFSAIQSVLAWVAGAIMILMGFALAGLIPFRAAAFEGDGFVASIFRHFFAQPSPSAALTLGLATGFLPCPIVLAFLALAMQSSSALLGAAIMAAMGLGTVWSLLILAYTGHLIRIQFRRRAAVLAAVVLIALGAATIARATPAFHRLLGCTVSPVAESDAAGGNAAPPSCPHCDSKQP